MKAIITGLNGTVAPVLAQHLSDSGHLIIPWDRSVVAIDNPDAIRNFISETKPDWFFHLATGSPSWAELVARACAEQGIKFLFTSSVSVFSTSQRGPFPVNVSPEPGDDYGRYKLECERRVQSANPDALVARLGWQIGTAPGGNHMVDFLERTFKTEGRIEASIHWYQACSFLPDTAQSLAQLMQAYPAGLYHLDGNPGLNFHEIVTNLNRLRNGHWVVSPVDTPILNNRMVDSRIQVIPITRRFQSEIHTF